ncbi:P-glycoprotein 6 [Actinidia rufa]|uniref:p-glycoprotein 6 n=1 Tax=Actinidia rufa TaxID=165716 RepID=A0A7J0DFF8_9ERIC|nr:P-glycoprotein 6 [Actinidia rufa]
MMISRGLFGWSGPHMRPHMRPHMQPLTPVLEVWEPPESPSPYRGTSAEAIPVEVEEEIEPPPAAVPFSRLFACADRFDWVLMAVGSLAAAAHGTALVVYLHYFAKIVNLLVHDHKDTRAVLFDEFSELTMTIVYIAVGVFAFGWIEVSCWILTGERQTAVIRTKYVEVGNYIHNMATFFSGLVIGFYNCWQIALITLATGPFIVAAGGISNIFLHRLAENIQDAYAEAASIAEQAVTYIRTLYAFTNETLAKYSYATSLQATLRYGISISLVQGLGLGFTYGVAICSCALQLWVGRFLVTHGRAHGGEIITALFAVILSGLGLNQAATNFYSFEQGRIAAYRLFEMISRSSSPVNHDGTTLPSVQGNIEFRNWHLSAEMALEKAVLYRLWNGFYDPTLGEVLLDGENIKNLKLEWLRSQIGLVTQEPALLSLSIRDNIAYGRPDATLDQIEEAAKIAHAHTHSSAHMRKVGRAGLALTEEQKIKLSVARAVLSNPSILLLDEVTGGLDFEAERSVQEALDLLMLGRSTIIIARRLSLIRNADYIAVMEEGQIVEMGTHDELITLDCLYAELLKCEEAAKLPRRMPLRNYKETAIFQIEKDSSASHSLQEPSSPKMMKSPSLQRVSGLHVFRPADVAFSSQESPRVPNPPPEQMVENGVALDVSDKEPSIRRQDSFGRRLPELPKIDVSGNKQISNASDPESPVSRLLTSDPRNERSHSQTFSRPHGLSDDVPMKIKEAGGAQHRKEPSFWRLVELSLAEWPYAVLGSTGAAIFGSFNPLLAYVIALVVATYYNEEDHHLRQEVNKWCLIITCMGIVTVVANFLQHYYFGIIGEKMTKRVRIMMFSAMLRNEVGWFDEEENSADTLSMHLANDATFVRAAFSNRLSIFIQDSAAVVVAVLIGMFLHWRLALVALATLPILTVSAVAQFCQDQETLDSIYSHPLSEPVRAFRFCIGGQNSSFFTTSGSPVRRFLYQEVATVGLSEVELSSVYMGRRFHGGR